MNKQKREILELIRVFKYNTTTDEIETTKKTEQKQTRVMQ